MGHDIVELVNKCNTVKGSLLRPHFLKENQANNKIQSCSMIFHHNFSDMHLRMFEGQELFIYLSFMLLASLPLLAQCN